MLVFEIRFVQDTSMHNTVRTLGTHSVLPAGAEQDCLCWWRMSIKQQLFCFMHTPRRFFAYKTINCLHFDSILSSTLANSKLLFSTFKDFYTLIPILRTSPPITCDVFWDVFLERLLPHPWYFLVSHGKHLTQGLSCSPKRQPQKMNREKNNSKSSALLNKFVS